MTAKQSQLKTLNHINTMSLSFQIPRNANGDRKAPPNKNAIGWVFTINNPTDEDDPHKWGAKYVSWQMEKGATLHYQGYVEWHAQKRLGQVKKINARAHWEPRMGTQEQAIAYTRKEDSRVDGPWEAGVKGPGQGKRSDLDLVVEKIQAGVGLREIGEDHGALMIQYGRGIQSYAQLMAASYDHDDVRGLWFWGAPGTGKSRKARELYPDAYLKQQNKWFDGYAGQDAVILDDLDKLGGDKLGHYLKIWADRYSCTAEVKGSTVNLQHKVFVITSNYHPDTMWPDDEEMLTAIKRRFKVTKFNVLQAKPKRKAEPDDINPTETKRAAIEDTQCPFGCPDSDACMCVQSGRAARQLGSDDHSMSEL
ncbi:MAG: putative viral replication protein [Circoviridae sp.]|nr:MAG: putative viral replication protein [Circoviridae sp.]